MGRASGEFLWFEFVKLSVVPQCSAKAMNGIINKVIKSKRERALTVEPLVCEETRTASVVVFSLSCSCSDVMRASFSVILATEPKQTSQRCKQTQQNVRLIFSCVTLIYLLCSCPISAVLSDC